MPGCLALLSVLHGRREKPTSSFRAEKGEKGFSFPLFALRGERRKVFHNGDDSLGARNLCKVSPIKGYRFKAKEESLRMYETNALTSAHSGLGLPTPRTACFRLQPRWPPSKSRSKRSETVMSHNDADRAMPATGRFTNCKVLCPGARWSNFRMWPLCKRQHTQHLPRHGPF